MQMVWLSLVCSTSSIYLFSYEHQKIQFVLLHAKHLKVLKLFLILIILILFLILIVYIALKYFSNKENKKF